MTAATATRWFSRRPVATVSVDAAAHFPGAPAGASSRQVTLMLWSFCSAKGGVGVSTIAASLGAELSARRPTVLVDLAGDLPDIFGVSSTGPGLGDWLASDAPVDAVDELAQSVGERLSLVPAGAPVDPATAVPHRVLELAEALQRDDRVVVADLGVVTAGLGPGSVLAAAAGRSTLVLRACYLGLRRARDLEFDFDDVIEVVEGGRALTTIDIEGVLGRPVDHRVAVDPSIARCVDAGLIHRRPPRALRRLASSLDRQAPETR